MKIYEVSFSPTGGTKKVADILAKEMQTEIVEVDLTDYKMDFQNVVLGADDVAIVAVPSYGGRMPITAIERLSRIKGNDARAVLVCVYGNRAYEDTLVELQDTVSETGFRTIAAVSAVAEHSIVRQIAEGRPNEEDCTQLKDFAKQILKKINEENTEEPMIPGNRPYKKRGSSGMVPQPTKECVQCGLCAEKCPVQAIDKDDSKKIDSRACISCMRCVSICPHSARKIDGVMLAGVGLMLKKVCANYRNDELFL